MLTTDHNNNTTMVRQQQQYHRPQRVHFPPEVDDAALAGATLLADKELRMATRMCPTPANAMLSQIDLHASIKAELLAASLLSSPLTENGGVRSLSSSSTTNNNSNKYALPDMLTGRGVDILAWINKCTEDHVTMEASIYEAADAHVLKAGHKAVNAMIRCMLTPGHILNRQFPTPLPAAVMTEALAVSKLLPEALQTDANRNYVKRQLNHVRAKYVRGSPMWMAHRLSLRPVRRVFKLSLIRSIRTDIVRRVNNALPPSVSRASCLIVSRVDPQNLIIPRERRECVYGKTDAGAAMPLGAIVSRAIDSGGGVGRMMMSNRIQFGLKMEVFPRPLTARLGKQLAGHTPAYDRIVEQELQVYQVAVARVANAKAVAHYNNNNNNNNDDSTTTTTTTTISNQDKQDKQDEQDEAHRQRPILLPDDIWRKIQDHLMYDRMCPFSQCQVIPKGFMFGELSLK